MNEFNYYVNSLPGTLKQEETAELFEKYKHNNDLEAREKLISHNLRLVVFAIKKMVMRRKRFEDLFSVGSCGLIKAVDTYDIEKNYNFVTYAVKCIQNEIRMDWRKEFRANHFISLETPAGQFNNSDGDNVVTLGDLLRSEDNIAKAEEQMFIDDDMAVINKYLNLEQNAKKKIVIEGLFGINGHERKNQSEVGQEMHHEQSYVSRIKDRALKEMERILQ